MKKSNQKAQLYCFLREIYGYLEDIAHIKVKRVFYGNPVIYLKAQEVHAYDDQNQELLPDLGLPYWQMAMLNHPKLFSFCENDEERLEVVTCTLASEQTIESFYLEWPLQREEKPLSTFLHLSFAELKHAYRQELLEQAMAEEVRDVDEDGLNNPSPEQTILTLPNGFTFRSEGEKYELGSYVSICDPEGKEILRWDKEEWGQAPELVMGAILGAIRHPNHCKNWAENNRALA